MKITITPSHAERALEFDDPCHCLLGTAIRKQGHYLNYALSGNVRVNGVFYRIPRKLYEFIKRAYGGRGYPRRRPIVKKPATFILKRGT